MAMKISSGFKQNNIVLIMADQLRSDFLGCYGSKATRTPHIDALAYRGMRFAYAVTPSPLCVPARASLLTGCNAIRTGVMDNHHWLRPDHEECGLPTWPALLSKNKYRTAAIGKMHFYPWDILEGFQERIIAEDKRHITIEDDYKDFLDEHGLRKRHGNEYPGYFENQGAVVDERNEEFQVDRWVAQMTTQWINRQNSEKPFALMVGFPSPHCPYDPPEQRLEVLESHDSLEFPPLVPATEDSDGFRRNFIAVHKQEWNQIDYSDFSETNKMKIRHHYAALVELVDACVGEIVACLDKNNLLDSTTIIFCSDHGDLLGDFDMVGKKLFYDSSIDIPVIVAGPTVESPGSVYSGLVSLVDIHSTILSLAGLTNSHAVDSIPLPCCAHANHVPRAYVFGQLETGFMLLKDRWKLSRYHTGATTLFDLVHDPMEQENLASSPYAQHKLREMDSLLQQELIQSILDANTDKRVATHDSGFGQRGWIRRYPWPDSSTVPHVGDRL